MKRRRFLTLIAGTLVCPCGSKASVWQGTALGADVSVTLTGPGSDAALSQVRATLMRMEKLFSLYRASQLTLLNATGILPALPPEMLDLCRIAGQVHALTSGCFDPTVQSLWTALATGGDIAAARRLIDWTAVTLDASGITLASGQTLTFNGIAQGFATDVVTAELAALGFTRALINIGEYRALGGPWHVAIADPAFGVLAQTTLTGQAIATSSPAALMVGGQPHILSRDGAAPHWSTVSITAPTAAMADALSTGFCLMDRMAIRATLSRLPGVTARLIDTAGNLTTA
ncbi:FAD:protein FMN transferase [Loktanella sp. M215]|uniref:FAD:protein FMN transferase n=1 Tax=Loktanella sp. M215 TaxID=2675431 RepID=UPI001F002DC3|nr:FAD:protein FMN transferase [Loktanella sp. M215]